MDVLHDQVDTLSGRRAVDTFVEFHDLGVLQLAQDLDLPEGRLLPLDVHELEAVIDLDRYFFPSRLV